MDISLDDTKVSVLHAELTCISGEWVLFDGGLSRNGCYVNGERVQGRRRLDHGDHLLLGRSEFVFCRGRVASPSAPPPPPGHLPEVHRRLLAELSRPLRERPQGLPATDTEIANALGATISAVRLVIVELFGWYSIREADPAAARLHLAELTRDVRWPGSDGGAS